MCLQVAEDEISDNSAECVVCLSDVRDTLILPCRHLCLCNACADTLRYQANCCPICRLRKHQPLYWTHSTGLYYWDYYIYENLILLRYICIYSVSYINVVVGILNIGHTDTSWCCFFTSFQIKYLTHFKFLLLIPIAFRALLQIRAMRKKLSPLTPTGFNPVITSQTSDSEEHSVTHYVCFKMFIQSLIQNKYI